MISNSREVDEAMKLSGTKSGTCTRALNFAFTLARNINSCRVAGYQPTQTQLDKRQRYVDDAEPKYRVARELLQDGRGKEIFQDLTTL